MSIAKIDRQNSRGCMTPIKGLTVTEHSCKLYVDWPENWTEMIIDNIQISKVNVAEVTHPQSFSFFAVQL